LGWVSVCVRVSDISLLNGRRVNLLIRRHINQLHDLLTSHPVELSACQPVCLSTSQPFASQPVNLYFSLQYNIFFCVRQHLTWRYSVYAQYIIIVNITYSYVLKREFYVKRINVPLGNRRESLDNMY
jgi:hypothetical protein